MATSDDGSNSTGSFIVSVVNDPNDDETLNTPPTQLGGIHRFGATFADGDIRQLSVSNFINGTDNETPTDQLGIAILGPTSDQGFEYSLDGSNWFQLALGIEERIHLNQSSSVRFVPDHEDGDFGLNYLIWDQSNNVANGSVTNFGLTDPSDAYSSESAQLRIQVAPPIPNAPLYPPADIDQSVNAISEDALIGTTVGITAFVEDQDAADSVTYSLAHDATGLFEIDAESGVVSLAGSDEVGQTIHHSVTFESIGGGNVYVVDGVQQPTLNLKEGNTYVFDVSQMNGGHPLRFSKEEFTSYDYGEGKELTGAPLSTHPALQLRQAKVEKNRPSP